MSTIPSGAPAPESKETFVYESAPIPRWIYVVLIVLLLLIGYLFYAGYTAQDKLQASLTAATNQEAVLSAEIDQSNSRVADMRAKLEVTSQKLGRTSWLARARWRKPFARNRRTATPSSPRRSDKCSSNPIRRSARSQPT
jgi:hypothetical protein